MLESFTDELIKISKDKEMDPISRGALVGGGTLGGYALLSAMRQFPDLIRAGGPIGAMVGTAVGTALFGSMGAGIGAGVGAAYKGIKGA